MAHEPLVEQDAWLPATWPFAMGKSHATDDEDDAAAELPQREDPSAT
jgi:hypothetical protein